MVMVKQFRVSDASYWNGEVASNLSQHDRKAKWKEKKTDWATLVKDADSRLCNVVSLTFYWYSSVQ